VREIKNIRFFALGIILVVTFWAYSPSFYHIPRSDQIWYLVKTSQRQDWFSLAIKSFALNRDVIGSYSAGDEHLFRPGVYFVLGTEKHFLGYNYFLWQGFGIFLHLLVVLTLFRLLSRIQEGTLSYIWTGVFALFFPNTEAVIWQHINAYLLFTCLVLLSLEQIYLYFSDDSKSECVLIAALFMTAATCICEIGCLYDLCIFISLWMNKRGSKGRNFAFVFIFIAFIFILIDVVHLWIFKIIPQEPLSITIGWKFCGDFVKNLVFITKWFLTAPFLLTSDIGIHQRLEAASITLTWGWPFNDWHWSRIAGLFVISIFVFLITMALRYQARLNKPFIFLVLFLLFAYLFILTLGRVSTRGLQGALYNTLYYFYNFWCLFIIFLHSISADYVKHISKKKRLALTAVLMAFVFIQALAIHGMNQKITLKVRPMRELFVSIDDLIHKHGHERNFSFFVYPSVTGNPYFTNITDPGWSRKYKTITELLYLRYFDGYHPKYILKPPVF